MNIWIFNHYAITPDTPGGTRHYDFAKELTKKGHKVSIFASSFSHRIRKDNKLNRRKKYKRENVGEVVFYWVKTSHYYGGNDWRRVINMLSYFHSVILLGMKLKEKPDVILASSPHLFTGLAGCILAKLRKTRFIFEIRDLWPQTLVDLGGYSNSNLIIRVLRALEQFLYVKAESIVVLMPHASNYITQLGIESKKIHWISNGVDAGAFQKTDFELPLNLQNILWEIESQEGTIVGYTGAHGVANALDTIIDAARLLQDEGLDKVHFMLVGDGPEKENLITQVKNLKLSNVVFYPSIPKTLIPKLLTNFDTTIISMRKTSLCKYGISLNKLYDYMASAKPIVWSTNSSNNPVAEADCGLTVEPENPEAMANAIIRMCSLSAEERREMGMRGYDYVMKYHSMPVLASKLLKVIEDVEMD